MFFNILARIILTMMNQLSKQLWINELINNPTVAAHQCFVTQTESLSPSDCYEAVHAGLNVLKPV